MDVYGSLRLKIPFWMSGIFTVSIYHLSLSQSLSSSLFIIHMSHVRNVTSGSAAQVQLGWDFATLGKYFMLFAIIHQPEHTFITLLFFYQRINISGVCILKVLMCVVERDCAYSSDWDSGNHLKRTLAVRGEIMRSLLLKALYLWSWSDSVLSALVCVCMTVRFCLGVEAQQISCEHLGLLSSSDVILSDSLSFSSSLSLSLCLWRISSSQIT